MYLIRTVPPKLNTKYYVPNGNENDMPNCTKDCHDRAQEACEDITLKLFTDIDIGGFPMADKWIEHSALPVGDVAKVGSICCCSSEGGSIHVFFVEDINDDGTLFISDSRWTADKSDRSDRFFRTVDNVVAIKGSSPIGINGCGKILGFQYLPIKDIRVKRDESKFQIKITKRNLQCRRSYGLSSPIINEGCRVPKGIYNVLKTKEADGYLWCMVEEGYWFAYSPDWAILYKVDEPIITPDEQLFINVESALNELRMRFGQASAAESKYKKIKDIIEEVNNG